MIVEVSGNYSIILPVMISNTIAYLVSRRFQQASLFDSLGRQDGTDLPSMEEERETAIQLVEDAMRNPDGVVLPGEETVERAVERAGQLSSEYFLVPLGGGAWAGLPRDQLLTLQASGDGDLRLDARATPIARPYLYPDQPVGSALRILRERPFVPVVHRADPGRLVGMLALEDVLRLYRTAQFD
jgi:CIC family chloride channel protein